MPTRPGKMVLPVRSMCFAPVGKSRSPACGSEGEDLAVFQGDSLVFFCRCAGSIDDAHVFEDNDGRIGLHKRLQSRWSLRHGCCSAQHQHNRYPVSHPVCPRLSVRNEVPLSRQTGGCVKQRRNFNGGVFQKGRRQGGGAGPWRRRVPPGVLHAGDHLGADVLHEVLHLGVHGLHALAHLAE